MAHLLLLGTLLIWSGSFLAARWVREVLSVPEALAARFMPVLVGAVLILAFRWRRLRTLPREVFGKVALMGLLGVPIYNLFFFVGLAKVPSGMGALLIATNPAFTAVAAALVLREPLGRRRIGGLLLALIGVWLVVSQGPAAAMSDEGDWRYALILLLAPLSWAGYTILGKSLPVGCDRFDATLVGLVIGSLPLAFFCTPRLVAQLAAHPVALWSSLYLGLLCTLFGFAAWIWALGRLTATETAAFVFLNPPLANLWAGLLGETRLTPVFLAGGLVLLAGMALIVFGRRAPAR